MRSPSSNKEKPLIVKFNITKKKYEENIDVMKITRIYLSSKNKNNLSIRNDLINQKFIRKVNKVIYRYKVI
jgi:hypothetical protein